MHHRPRVGSVSFSLCCLLALGSIPLGTAALASVDPDQIFPDPLYSTYPYSTYSTLGSYDSVAVADFNGDQALDLAIAHSRPGDISILLARGDGGFEPERRLPHVGELSSIAAADFNGDGKPDLVVTDSTLDRIVVFLGSGDGSFVMGDAYPVAINPSSVTVADLNLDDVPDLVLAICCSGDVSVLLGVGNGTFLPEHRFPTGLVLSAYSLAVTDFNQDGYPDLAVTSGFDSKEAVLLFGQGNGAFDPPVSLGGSQGGESICAADFNLDGHPDLAVSNAITLAISVLLGDGAGGVQSRISNDFESFPSASWLAAADLDGDGVPDLATRNATFHGHGDGSFGSAVPFSASLYTGAIADLDTDGNPDLVGANDVAAGGVFVLYNDGRGQMGVNAYPTGVYASTVLSGDFDGNGFTDLAASGPFSGEISVLPGREDGTFAPETLVPAGDQIAGMASGDFDGDGRLDLAFYQPLSGILSMLRGTGDGGFQPPVQTTIHDTPSSLAVGEFNGDGRVDLVSVRDHSEFLQVLLGKPDGTFEVIDQVGPQLVAVAASVGDFNADGKQDVAVAYPGIGSVSILLGHGDGTFGLGEFYGAGDHLSALVVADLNGDGKLDLAAGHASSLSIPIMFPQPGCCEAIRKVSVLLGRGDGTLGEETRYDSGLSFTLGVADFDQDGHLDLVSSSSTILFGGGDGTFARAQQFAQFGPGVMDDFNRDGWPDVAMANREIFVALNQGPVQSNRSPVAMAGVDTALECASPSGAEALLDGSASSDPDSTPGTTDDIDAFDWFEDYGLSTQQRLGSGETLYLVLPLGVHAITLRVTDRAGASSTSETSIRVADTVPPRISVHLTPDTLWPPNNQMVDISAEVTVTDACGQPAAKLSSIQSSGPASVSKRNGYTTGGVSGAVLGTSDFNFQLQSERSTSRQGCSYLVTYIATDAAGNQSSATGVVRVLHDRRRSSGASPSP